MVDFGLGVLVTCMYAIEHQHSETGRTLVTVNISNVQPHRDVLGRLMDIHDGAVIKVGKQFWWYGMYM